MELSVGDSKAAPGHSVEHRELCHREHSRATGGLCDAYSHVLLNEGDVCERCVLVNVVCYHSVCLYKP